MVHPNDGRGAPLSGQQFGQMLSLVGDSIQSPWTNRNQVRTTTKHALSNDKRYP